MISSDDPQTLTTPADAVTVLATFDAANQITSLTSMGVEGVSTTAYTYNERGARTLETVTRPDGTTYGTQWSYDELMRVTAISRPGRDTDIERDVTGRASTVTARTGQGETVTEIGYDGWDPATTSQPDHADMSVLSDMYGQPLAEVDSDGTQRWLITSILGDITATANETGALTELADAADYGTTTLSNDGWSAMHTSTGELSLLAADDAVLFHQRVYQAGSATWNQADALVSANRHNYVAANPTTNIDMYGFRRVLGKGTRPKTAVGRNRGRGSYRRPRPSERVPKRTPRHRSSVNQFARTRTPRPGAWRHSRMPYPYPQMNNRFGCISHCKNVGSYFGHRGPSKNAVNLSGIAALQPARAVTEEEFIDGYEKITALPLEDFLGLRSHVLSHPDVLAASPYDWYADGCSIPLVSYPDSLNGPCLRHDFGYTNARLAGQDYGPQYNNVDESLVARRFKAAADIRLREDIQNLPYNFSFMHPRRIPDSAWAGPVYAGVAANFPESVGASISQVTVPIPTRIGVISVTVPTPGLYFSVDTNIPSGRLTFMSDYEAHVGTGFPSQTGAWDISPEMYFEVGAFGESDRLQGIVNLADPRQDFA